MNTVCADAKWRKEKKLPPSGFTLAQWRSAGEAA